MKKLESLKNDLFQKLDQEELILTNGGYGGTTSYEETLYEDSTDGKPDTSPKPDSLWGKVLCPDCGIGNYLASDTAGDTDR